MFIELLLTFIFIFFIFDFIAKKRKIDHIVAVPGPKAWPIIGNILLFVNKTPENILDYTAELINEYGPMYRLWMLNELTVISADPKDIEVVLSSSKHITKNDLYGILHSWLGTGLLLSTGQKWHSRRKAITPTFHFKILEQFVDVFDQQSAVLVEQLKSKADGKTAINIHPIVCLAALDIIAETAMGTKINAQVDKKNKYTSAVNEITNIMADRFVKTWQRREWVFALANPKNYSRQKELIKVLHAYTENIITERREALEKSISDGTYKPKNDQNEDMGTKQRMALLDVLLQSNINGKPLSNEDIREEVDTFMFEGHDTTTSALSFALYLLARNPEAQQKFFEETQEIIGKDKTAPVTYRSLQDLKYAECIIKESLRLYPSVPLIGRYFSEDVDINGKNIPAGSNFVVNIFHILRNEKYFPEPEKFIPERHLAEKSNEKTDPYAYIPFSAGPRNCIGQKFAILVLKSILSKVVRYYEIVPLGPDVRLTLTIVLRSVNGVHIGLKPRE